MPDFVPVAESSELFLDWTFSRSCLAVRVFFCSPASRDPGLRACELVEWVLRLRPRDEDDRGDWER